MTYHTGVTIKFGAAFNQVEYPGGVVRITSKNKSTVARAVLEAWCTSQGVKAPRPKKHKRSRRGKKR